MELNAKFKVIEIATLEFYSTDICISMIQPTTELESAVDKLLKSAKMREEDIAQTETLKMNHLSVEEVAARRAELAKMRELMFRAEAKAKRVAKIKSKTYRRIKKRERRRLAEKLGEGSEDDDDDEEAQMRRETERAKERATLRHKNTGKWAKAMKGRAELDVDQRRDILEMLDRGEKLRRKIRGERESGDEEDSESDDSDGEDGEGAIERIKANAFDELAQLGQDDGAAPEGNGKKGKSIFEMKFMKDAMARDQRRADEMADDFAKELGGLDAGDGEDGVDADMDEPSHGATVERVGGRVVYRPGAMVSIPVDFDQRVTNVDVVCYFANPLFSCVRYLKCHPQVHRLSCRSSARFSGGGVSCVSARRPPSCRREQPVACPSHR